MSAEIGRRIQEWMAGAGMRQGGLADALGVTQAAISRKLAGERPWFPEELVAVASLFGRDVGELFGEIPAAAPVMLAVAV